MNEKQKMKTPWHSFLVKEVFENIKTSAQGLQVSEAQDRLEIYGENALAQKKPVTLFSIVISQFKNPLMLILVAACLVSGLLNEWLDATVIIFAVFLNAVLGTVEEYKADRSMEELKSFLPQMARVRRGGVESMVGAEQIVPGDIIIYKTGDKIVADCRVIFHESLEVNEAALTGESAAIKKQKERIDLKLSVADRKNMLFAGTVVVAGRCEAVVVATGAQTEIGQIAELVAGVEDLETPLQQQIGKLARWIGVVVLGVTILVFAAGLLRGFEMVEMIRISIAIAVSAIPEGMVVALTVILAIGMQRILKKKALVRKLVAAETLGGVSVICMDKTGTLTTGKMALVEVCNSKGKCAKNLKNEKEIAQALWNTRNVFVDEEHKAALSGSSTEVAIAQALWADRESYLECAADKVAEIPFDSQYKYKARVCDIKGQSLLYVVGAPEILLEKLDASDAEIAKFTSILEKMTKRGLRVLMVTQVKDFKATKLDHDDIKDLKFLGLIGLSDPLRSSAAETIRKARRAGLRPIMITGDHPETAFQISREAGLISDEEQIMTGAQLDEIDDAKLAAELNNIVVFARVLPRHKLRIVNAWRNAGHSVAMTGDGVNDAPAVKGADIGIALGSGTEVTKETADMVLLNDKFSTIVGAIEQGRVIFDNIRKMVVYLLSDSFSEIILIFGAILFGFPLPILPAQILWINLITDGFPSIALTFEPGEKGIMKEKPRKKSEPILNKEMKVLIFIIGIITDLILFAIFFFMLKYEFDIAHIRTFIFMALGVDSLIYVFAVRKFRTSIFTSNPFENKFLIGGIAIGFVMLLLPMIVPGLRAWFGLVPLSLLEWSVLVPIAVAQLLMIEVVKLVFNRRSRLIPKAI